MDDLVSWLRAQLDEDERVARPAALKGHQSWRTEYGGLGDLEVVDDAGRLIVSEMVNMAEQAKHIALWDPARVLAAIDAKRRILDLWSASDANAEFPNYEGGHAAALEDVFRLLALPYAAREGYRDEWRP